MRETDRKTNQGVGVLWDETCRGIQLTEWSFPHSSWSRCGETGKGEGEGGVEAHTVFITLPLVRCLYYPGPAVPLPRWILHFFSFPFVVYYRILTIVPCAIQQDLIVYPSYI